MKNIKRLFVLLLITLGLQAQAQTGNYFLSHYAPSDERIDYVTFDIAQDVNGVIYFANKSGVLAFDGRNWSLIATPGPVYTVTTVGADVYVGGAAGYGKLVWGADNALVYLSLSAEQPQATQIISSIFLKDKLYLMNGQSVYIFSTAAGKTEAVVKAQPTPFTALFEMEGEVYVETESNQLFKIENNTLKSATLTIPGNQVLLFTSALANKNHYLLGTSNQVFSYEPAAGLKKIPLQDSTFLEKNVVVSGTWVNESLAAIGTLRGGVLFFNPSTGETREITNYHTGLPDNEVYAIFTDRNLGVWVGHDYGFTRIAPFLPFRSYSHYPGLSGNLLCSHSYRGQLYVGTTLGLFALVREELYETESYFVGEEKKQKQVEEVTSKRSGIFTFFKRSKKAIPTPVEVRPAKKQRKDRKILTGIRYAFKPVDGISGKVNQLTEVRGKLLAAGISGVLEVDGLKSIAVLSEPVHYVFLSSALQQLFVSTFNDEVKTFALGEKEGWKESHLVDTLNQYVGYIFQDKFENVWLCARNGAYKIEIVDNQITEISNVMFQSISVDESIGVGYGNEVYVAASGKFNRYDVQQNKFVSWDSFPGPKRYFASAGYFWFFGKASKEKHAQWRTVDPRMERSLKLEWLGLFQNIRYLAPTEKEEGLWVITAANELYKFSSNMAAVDLGGYPLFLREVRSQQSKITPARSLKVSQLESTIAFDFIQPDFLGMKAIEYRYRVIGLDKGWSDWSTDNNIVNFSFLPTGDYKVEVQTLDLMGKISEPTLVDLGVEPPYWKESWFFAVEFVIFSFLVFMSLRLSAGNHKYRIISRVLSMLTVILLIQFIQTVVASQISVKSSPVTDFFIQVFIALLVLPIEGYLRKFMLRSADQRGEPPRIWDERK